MSQGARRFILNSSFNLLGQVLPLLAGLICIPLTISGLGVERFGVLTVTWIFIGYFSIFDFGLSRTMTAFMSEAFALDRKHELRSLFHTTMTLILGLSLIGSLVVSLALWAPLDRWTELPPALLRETQVSMLWIAISLPLVTLMTGCKGALEAKHSFFELNILQLLLGLYTFVSPVLALKYTHDLDKIVLSLMIGRGLFFVAHLLLAFYRVPEIRGPYLFEKKWIRRLLSFGGWLSVSNVVGPVMVYFDRFILSFYVNPAQVAYYTTPFEMISRFSIVPSSLTRTLFPLASEKHSKPGQSENYLAKLTLATGAILLPACALTYALAPWGLSLWLGDDFAILSSPVLRILCLGIFMNCLAWIPFTLIQARQRPDLTAKLHLAELPLYLVFLFFIVPRYGIQGAAWAWTLRAVVDSVILFVLYARLKKSGGKP